MNRAELVNLPLLAKTAYAIMCFERYAAFAYPETNLRPAAKIMWQMVDGSEPPQNAASRYLDIIPENLFAHDTYEAYLAAGHSRLTAAQFELLTRILNPDDLALNSMMRLIYQIATTYADADVPQGAVDTLPYLEETESLLTDRMIALPDLRLFRQYSFLYLSSAEKAVFDWRGNAVDPSPLSLLGITAYDEESEKPASPNKSLEAKQVFDIQRNDTERSFGISSDNTKAAVPHYEKPIRPVVEANGCQWEIIVEPDGCIISRCMNRSHLKEVTIPSMLNGLTVIEIDDNVFTNDPETGCAFIETLVMPDSIRKIGKRFFAGCAGLRQITLPAMLESIGHEAFRGASRLERLTVGDRCWSIGDYFCADAVSLQSVTIGSGISYIGEYTFYNTPAMTAFRCNGMLRELGYGSFWVNRWADGIIFQPGAEQLRFCKDNALLYRYVKRMPPPRLFFDRSVRYVYDFAFGGDAWNSGSGISDIFLPGAEKIGVNAFKKVPNATVHLSASRMRETYGQDYVYTLNKLCQPARVVFDQS